MQQRQLRLGDILDDYCPRERRITNHAVVAMVGDTVKLTRCTTCDSEHAYKQAKAPTPRRKKDGPTAAYSAVLASVQQDPAAIVAMAAAHAAREGVEIEESVPTPEPAPAMTAQAEPATIALPMEPVAEQPAGMVKADAAQAAPTAAAQPASEAGGSAVEPARVHRRLIRAQLPRIEGTQPVARPIPQFTMHDARSLAGSRGRGGHRAPGGHRAAAPKGVFTRDASRGGGFQHRGGQKPMDGNRKPRPSSRPQKHGKKRPR